MNPISADTPRYDLYCGIHKALRAYMGDTLALVGSADWEDAVDRSAALARLRELLQLCAVHLDDENRFVHPALEARQAGIATRIAGEHVHHQQDIEDLSRHASRVESAGIGATAEGMRLYHRLSQFVAGNFEHMLFEETEHNRVLWNGYSDEQLAAIEADIVAALPPAAMGAILPWFLSALSHVERVGMLSGMSQGMPPEAFAGVMAMAQSRLSARDWDKLQRARMPLAAAA